MSKKRRSRHMPPATQQQNKAARFKWDDLQAQFQALLEIYRHALGVQSLLNNKEACEKLENFPDVVERAGIVARDLEHYYDKLIAIHRRHKDLTGELKPDEYMVSIQIFEDYLKWNDSFEAVVIPNVMFIAGEFNKLESENGK